MRYGPEHLERLERIRALQARRFSLAAIRALLDATTARSRGCSSVRGRDLRPRRARRAAGVSAELVARPRERRAAPRSRRARPRGLRRRRRRRAPGFADLGELGVPDAVLVELARDLADGLDEIQHQLAALFPAATDPNGASAAASSSARGIATQSGRVVRDMRVIADYTQHRNIQRIRAGHPGPHEPELRRRHTRRV